MGIVIGIVVIVALGLVGWLSYRRPDWPQVSRDLGMTGDVQVLALQVGSGKLLITLAKQVTNPGKVIGVVTSEKQAQKVRSAVAAAEIADRAKIVLTDNTNLTFADHRFDYVVVPNLAQVSPEIARSRVLQEAIRVLALRGTLVVVSGSKLTNYRQLLEYYGFKDISVKRSRGTKMLVARRN